MEDSMLFDRSINEASLSAGCRVSCRCSPSPLVMKYGDCVLRHAGRRKELLLARSIYDALSALRTHSHPQRKIYMYIILYKIEIFAKDLR